MCTTVDRHIIDKSSTWKIILWSFWYSLDRCAIKSPWYLLHAEEQWSIYLLHAGIEVGRGGGCSLMPPNNTPVYSVLGLPLLNTFLTFQWLHSIQKSAKRDLRCLFSPRLAGRYTMIPWELPGTWWGGGQCLYCLISIGSQCCISVAVLVNNCFLWQNSSQSGINCPDL